MRSDAAIVGWSHTPFGKHGEVDIEDLILEVASDAIADAGISPDQIGEIFVGNYGGAFSRQGFPSSLALQADAALRFTPATRVENACATGSAAVHQGLKSIAAREADHVLVIGVEKMTGLPNQAVGEALLSAAYVREEAGVPGGFAGVFGVIASEYFDRYGDQSDALARIAAKNHGNGAKNPLAQIQKDLGFEFCRQTSDSNPQVAGPLKRTDCSLVSDGAAALVLASGSAAKSHTKAVGFKSAVQVNDFLPMSRRDVLAFDGCAQAWQRAHEQAGTTIDDLSLVETHDCFTIAELLEYEAMGLTQPGQGARALEEGWTHRDGKLPINLSGGLKSKGHPIGATGVSMHIMAAMQLTNSAGEMQHADAQTVGVFNMGGVAVANYVSILESVR